MAKTKKVSEGVCCPEFEPGKWDKKILEWKNKKFVKAKVFTLFYIPINFGGVMRKLDEKIREAGAEIQDNMGLSEHTSKFNMDVYLAVNREVPGLENTAISGKFLCRVYEGPYSDTGKWGEDFAGYAKGMGLKTGRMFMWYTTCPKCAEKYGKNHVAIIAEVGK